ncbi:MAG: TfoX/Sxy family protein [Oscillospiraceae bacterium]|jgi:TfoX/Sxy family transcriptional regulator of competence genes|nr:TfoX/Sxy family protein [Oscillospiraceae bacterium]
MATSPAFMEYAADRIRSLGFETTRYRKMFGEYMLYVDDKPVVIICDNVAMVKVLPELYEPCHRLDKQSPYSGAKEHYVLDLDDADKTRRIIDILVRVTKVPVKKQKPSKKLPLE